MRPRALHAAHARTHTCTRTLGRAVVSQWCNLPLPGHQGAAAHWGLRPWAARRGDACGPDRGLGPQGGSEAACLSPWACCSKSCPGRKASAPLGALGPRGGGHRPTPAPPEVWATLPGSVFRTCPSWAVTSGDKVQGRPTALLVLKILATLTPCGVQGPWSLPLASRRASAFQSSRGPGTVVRLWSQPRAEDQPERGEAFPRLRPGRTREPQPAWLTGRAGLCV